HITLDVDAREPDRVTRCLELFEDYCVVTASVRKGISTSVVVTDPAGVELYRHDD
ncbi:MAG: OsmC family peroxiredoxin, partial [Gemmatimonadales bacterium]|nr:OsmC family peroxiredoxin [Gemmatimonadales bacterium]